MFRRTVIRRGVLAVAVGCALGLLFTAPAAQAAPAKTRPTLTMDATPVTSGRPVAHIEVDMKYDCAGMTGQALNTAIAQGNCPRGGATPDNTTTGTCGSAWVDIFDTVPLDGLGTVNWGMTSFQGIMITRNLNLAYTFTTIDQGIIFGNLIDAGLVFSSTYAGSATATSPLPSGLAVIMTGTVSLLNGTGCIIIPPQDFKTIS